MNNSESLVQVRGLVVDRGDNHVLRGLDLSIDARRVTGLLGPSGSGKSTLMRAICGVQNVRAGTIDVLGAPAGDKAIRGLIGYVTQSPSVYDDLTVRENIEFFAAMLAVDTATIDLVLERVDLTAKSGQLVGALSGGQRSRVSLAAALLGDPRLLVLDEPTVGLDPVLREQLWATFHEIAEAGAALLVSSHVMDEASRCDRLLLMHDGEIVADATPDEIRSKWGTDDLDECFLRIIRAEDEVTR